MVNNQRIWDTRKSVFHCNWHRRNGFYSRPGLLAVHMWRQWYMLPYEIHALFVNGGSTVVGMVCIHAI